MKVFTKLGLALLVIALSSGMLWAQKSTTDVAAQEAQAKFQKLVDNGILDKDPNAKPSGITSTSDDIFDLQFSWPAGVGGGEAGLETDGNYVYTTKWNGTGEFYRYAMDGTYIEVFTIAGASGVRDLAYNGTYFYGGAATTNVFELDLANGTLISQFTAPTAVRAIAYNEDDEVFYANNWSTDVVAFDASGANQGSFPTGPFGSSYYGFAYDNYCDGTYLWGYAQTDGTVPADQNWLVQMELPSGTETGVTFDVTTLITPVTGIAGGLCVSDAFVSGYYTLAGNMQNEFIWGLELCQGTILTNDIGITSIVEPSSGIGLTNAENVTVNIKNHGSAAQSTFDVSFTLDGGTPVTETYSGTLNPGETISHTFATTVDLSAIGSYDFEACTDLAGDENADNDCKTKTVENQVEAYCDASTDTEDEWISNVLCGSINNPSGWQGGVADYTDQSTSIPQGGSEDIVVSNGNAYAADQVTAWVDWNMDYTFEAGGNEEFILTNVGGTGDSFEGAISVPAGTPEGDYRMRVRMVWNTAPVPCGPASYGEVEDYSITVGEGLNLEPPTNLVADVVGPDMNDVALTWDAPATGGAGVWVHWDDQTNNDGIGLTNGGTFMGAARWDPTDLAAFDGQYLTKVTYYHYNNAATATVTIMVWTGANAGTLVASQDVTTPVVDAWNEITLDDPIMIDATQDLWIGFETTHPVGENPIGVDAGPAIAQKGDMISLDGATWVSMSIEYSLDFNWNIGGYISEEADGMTAQPLVKETPATIADPSFVTGSELGYTSSNKKFMPSSAKALTGYNVYRNTSEIASNIPDTFYDDMDLNPGTYNYYVTAVYDEGESGPSNTETVVIQGGTSGEIFCDDFNSYTVGGQLVDQNPTDWTTWSNSPGSAEDPYIVDNGGNVVEITGTNDLVYVMPNYTNGYFEITFDLFVPTGGDAYFNTLQEFAGTASSWGMQVYFGETNPGEGNLDAGGALAQLFTFDYDTWMAVKVTVDLDNDWGEFYLDDVLIHGWQWSTGSFGTGDLNQLGGNNFYAWADGANGNPLYHFDNYCLNGETINLEPVTNVTATPDGTDVLVEWEAPDPGALTEIDDDFESYEDFTLDFAPWTNIDVDGSTTYGMTGIDWPNAYDAQAFIIFNPSMTTPAVTDIIPHSGDKLAACFASTTPDNDDWMITPKVLIESGDQLSFWVKSYTADYGLERYKVGVSTTGMDPADFTIVSGANYLEAPATDWEEYTYDMSSYAGQEVYVGIQCVSSDAFIFLVDDFSIGGSKSFAVNNNTAISGSASKDISANAVPGKPNTVFGGQKGVDALTGFNVYRNDGFVDFVSAPTTEYLDQGLSAGTYEYCVTAVYDEGESIEACADPVTIGSIFPAPPMNVEAMATIDGDIDVTWDVPGMEWIRWDAGVNNGNGVGLTNGGTFSVSSHWSPEDIAPYHGLSIETISFYANADPAATYTVKVWTGSNGLTEIYSQDVSTFTVDDWNDIALTTPVTIDANDHIWFGYECTHGAGTFPAGCDDGPALLGKGDMILSGGAWVDLVSLSATLDYNWNLGAYLVAADGSKTEMITKPVVAPASLEVAESGTTGVSNKFNPGSTKELTGYNVYHNLDGGTMELLDFVTTNSYTHTGAGMVVGLHCYDITAVYDPEGESEPAQGCEQIDNVAEFGNNMIQIFPNPASDVVNIKSDVTITSITVYNYAGQIVVNEEVQNTTYKVNTSQMQSGIYFFQIDTEDGRVSQRIIVE